MSFPLRTCTEPGSTKPCRFAKSCPATRQELHASYDPPINGMKCWVYSDLTYREVDPNAEERKAIAEEPAA